MDRIAFVCVGNAGRSQMATAFAERERDRRGLDVEIVTGGTDPADRVHREVVDAMREKEIDVGDQEPREITAADVEDADAVVTMGCSFDEFRPEAWTGSHENWDVSHPSGEDLDAARAQRDEIERRVVEFFDRLEAEPDE